MKNKPKRLIGAWNLKELPAIEKNGLKVFSCFHCGGGSTMGYKLSGYKLSGYDVIGGVEIDSQMMQIYKANHNPTHSYLMGVKDFVKIPNSDLPNELFDIDVLDGSPPCSTFSMAGSREKKWGAEHHFKEGQAKQHLDDLFFDFIAVANKLKPKVIIAENVKGLIQGKARGYVKQIFTELAAIGYSTQLFLLNAAAMGVPQARERTFFISVRNDISKKLVLNFNELPIPLSLALTGINYQNVKIMTGKVADYWAKAPLGGQPKKLKGTTAGFISRAHPNKPASTLTSSPRLYHYAYPRRFVKLECVRIQSFPDDYNFLNQDEKYICGMSVPPLMMQRVALEVGKQIFDIEYDQQIDDRFTKGKGNGKQKN